MSEEYTLQELARGLQGISQQISQLHTELSAGHQRLRHDVSNLQTSSAAHYERIQAHGRELGVITDSVGELRQDNKRLLWSVIAAYGAIILAVLIVLLGKVF